MSEGIPWQSSGYDSILPLKVARVRSLVGGGGEFQRTGSSVLPVTIRALLSCPSAGKAAGT